jgi:hypothetical protein
VAVDKLFFRNRPDTSLEGMQRDVYEYTQRIKEVIGGLATRLLTTKTIGTTETRIEHGLSSVPVAWKVANQRGVGSVYQTRAADSRYLYLARTVSGLPDECSLRQKDIWYLWGHRGFATQQELVPGAEIRPGQAAGMMMAVPEYFPEPCTITKLATILLVDTNLEQAWIGLARDTIVNGDHYPGATIAGSAVRVVGGGTASKRLRGGTVAIKTYGNETLWWLFQDKNGPAGKIYGAAWRPDWLPSSFGLQTNLTTGAGLTTALALDAVVPGTVKFEGWVGYTANSTTYTVGRDFGAGGGLLPSNLQPQMWVDEGWAMPLFQVQRFSSTDADSKLSPPSTFNTGSLVVDIEVL